MSQTIKTEDFLIKIAQIFKYLKDVNLDKEIELDVDHWAISIKIDSVIVFEGRQDHTGNNWSLTYDDKIGQVFFPVNPVLVY